MFKKTHQSFADRFDQRVFEAIYARALVYNACWEDPAVDRLALNIGADDTMLVITSAGCNVLDYALTGPRRIHAVDANPRQSALLELKLAGIRRLDFEDFFEVFGNGYHPRFREFYGDVLRGEVSASARTIWDWMSCYFPRALAEEWFRILRRAARDARIIFRSAHAAPTYLEHLEFGAKRERLDDCLTFHKDFAAVLQRQDRVHTYAGFHVADVNA